MSMYKDNSADWIFLAESDLKAARIVLQEEIYHTACFHAQQAIEKSLKAILRHRQKIVPKTHSLAKLAHEVEKSGNIALNENDLIFVDQFYIPTRYPDTLPGSLPEGLPTKKDAEKAIHVAQTVFAITKKRISSNPH